MAPAVMTENRDVPAHFNHSSPHEWSLSAHEKFPLKRLPDPLRIDSISPHEGVPDPAELEPQTPTAHKPTLKGVGKSDCEVKIVSISECESEIPPEAFADKNSRMCPGWLLPGARELIPCAQSGQVMLCRTSSPMREHSHQRMVIRILSRALAQLRPEKRTEDPSLRGEAIRLLHVCLVSLHVRQDPANMSVEQQSVA